MVMMKNKIEFVIGFSLVFLIFIPNMGQHSLYAKSLNSDPSNLFLEGANWTYHQRDQLIPISYKTQSISLGPILENVPGLEINNSGIILKEQNNNLSIGLDKKLDKLGEGLLDNKDDAPKQQQEDEDDNVGDGKKEANVNTEKNDENVQNGNNNLEKQEILKKQQEDKPKVDNNGEDEDESSPFGLNFNFNSNLDTNVEVDKIKIAELNKKLQDLKDRLLNDQDNHRLVEQREADEASKDEVTDKEQVKAGSSNYDGYGYGGTNYNGKNEFNFAAAGDYGCSTNTQRTVVNIQKQEPELVLALGDLSYHSTADCWFDIMSPLKGKMMMTFGYHDVQDGQTKTNQYLKSFGLEKQFYSYDYNNVHFLVMAAESDFEKGSEQYNFVLDDLKKASEDKDVNWIIVSSYGPLYTSPSEHKAYSSIRDLYHPIFEKYGVDLVLGGHNHNYQRTYPITYNPADSSEPLVTNDLTTGYDGQKDGIVFAIVGTGGVNFYAFEGQAPFVDKQFDGNFGFLDVDISNDNSHSKLTGTFYDNQEGKILDKFTIEKEVKNNNAKSTSNDSVSDSDDSVFG
jgi:hypothetical protein